MSNGTSSFGAQLAALLALIAVAFSTRIALIKHDIKVRTRAVAIGLGLVFVALIVLAFGFGLALVAGGLALVEAGLTPTVAALCMAAAAVFLTLIFLLGAGLCFRRATRSIRGALVPTS